MYHISFPVDNHILFVHTFFAQLNVEKKKKKRNHLKIKKVRRNLTTLFIVYSMVEIATRIKIKEYFLKCIKWQKEEEDCEGVLFFVCV